MKRKKGLILGCRKGNAVLDSITAVVVIFVFVLVMIIGKYVFDEMNTDIQESSDITNTTKDTLTEVHSRSGSFMDGLIIFFFLLIWALMIVASFKIDSHPAFFIFTLILMVFIFFIAANLGNAYEEVIDDPDLGAVVSNDFPMTNWIMTHFLLVAIIIGFSVILALFGKNRMNQE